MIVRTLSVAAVALIGSAFSSMAGEQYVDSSGYAVSGYDVVAYFDLEQSPLDEDQPEAVRGSVEHITEHNMAMWAFSSAENLEKFKADPDKYVPAYDGHCAYGVSRGAKVPANPNLWRIVDDKLYLNKTRGVYYSWVVDIPSNITRGDGQWGRLETNPASTNEVPRFDGPLGPIVN